MHNVQGTRKKNKESELKSKQLLTNDWLNELDWSNSNIINVFPQMT